MFRTEAYYHRARTVRAAAAGRQAARAALRPRGRPRGADPDSVCALLREGLGPQAVAERLGISVGVVQKVQAAL
jgi:DNA invertase Pin-like site-specific DNA recombinase